MKTSPDELVKLGFIQQGNRSMWVKDKIAVNFGLIPHIGNKFNPVIEEYYLRVKLNRRMNKNRLTRKQINRKTTIKMVRHSYSEILFGIFGYPRYNSDETD